MHLHLGKFLTGKNGPKTTYRPSTRAICHHVASIQKGNAHDGMPWNQAVLARTLMIDKLLILDLLHIIGNADTYYVSQICH